MTSRDAGRPAASGESVRRSILHSTLPLALGAVLFLSGSLAAAPVYKYRDANGNLVYAEQKPDSATTSETIVVSLDSKAPRIAVEKVGDAEHLELRAINECLCVVEFEVRVLEARNLNIPDNAVYHSILQPQSQKQLAQGTHDRTGEASLRYTWKAVLGVPGAQHVPREPYRAPFAIGASYLISQAYPTRSTHNSPDAQYAVDLALPDGTPVYAARDGTVINLRHDSFRGAATPLLMDQANMVEILHDDGTIAVYAHLHWDSIRVQPGQRVRRGEYIADSGNTGFTTGAHLHFAVIRNAGLEAVSVPIQFSGPAAVAVTPQQNMMLTAY
jgi:murein DD-endopeptidase MepM/ murein hydrolase activator NlpD